MPGHGDAPRVASARRDIEAPAGLIFGLIADPAQQPRWDGNDNLAEAAGGQLSASLTRLAAIAEHESKHLTGS